MKRKFSFDKDYPESFDYEKTCPLCGCVFDERYFDECPNCEHYERN